MGRKSASASGSDRQSCAVYGVIGFMLFVLFTVGMLVVRSAYLASKQRTEFMQACTQNRPPGECEQLWQVGMRR